MLRVGLTGGLGSGKTTIAQMFAQLGAHVIEADAIGRRLMQPGEGVYQQIVARFGPAVLAADGKLNRQALADLAFRDGRLSELNQIVHPPVIAAQEDWMHELFARDTNAIAMVESALIFEADSGGTVPGWRDRFDRIILVAAPDALKVARFVQRMQELTSGENPAEMAALEQDAKSRLAAQIPDREKIAHCDYIIDNSGSAASTRTQVETIFPELQAAARN